jgi:hypothetical protein
MQERCCPVHDRSARSGRSAADAEHEDAMSSRPPGAPTTYPLDYMDRGCLAATSPEHGSSNAPTWDLVGRGQLDPDVCREALQLLCQRYPSCASRIEVREGRGDPSTRLQYTVREPVDLDALFHFVDLRGRPTTELDALAAQIRDRFLDPFQRYPLQVTLARCGDDAFRLFFQQHHALSDGRAFIELLGDFAELVTARASGAPPAAIEPVPRRSELDALELGRGRSFLYGLAGLRIWLAISAGQIFHPLRPLYHNRSRDYRGPNATLHWTLDRKALDAWKPLRERHGVSLNTLLTAAYLRAQQRWNRELGIEPGLTRITLVAETRPRHGGFRSFANHLGALLAQLPLDQDLEPLAMMASIQEQVRRQARADAPRKRLVFERATTAAIPLENMRKACFEGTGLGAQLSFSNLISLPFPRLAGPGWSIEAVHITTPVIPPFGVLLTVIRYGDEICFNFNHKATLVTREQIADLVDHFEAALAEMTAALAA